MNSRTLEEILGATAPEDDEIFGEILQTIHENPTQLQQHSTVTHQTDSFFIDDRLFPQDDQLLLENKSNLDVTLLQNEYDVLKNEVFQLREKIIFLNEQTLKNKNDYETYIQQLKQERESYALAFARRSLTTLIRDGLIKVSSPSPIKSAKSSIDNVENLNEKTLEILTEKTFSPKNSIAKNVTLGFISTPPNTSTNGINNLNDLSVIDSTQQLQNTTSTNSGRKKRKMS